MTSDVIVKVSVYYNFGVVVSYDSSMAKLDSDGLSTLFETEISQ